MNRISINRLGLKLALAVVLVLSELANAQTYFTDTLTGDVNAGFRKTGAFQEQYEMVVYLGNITNFMLLPAGTQINITNYNHQQLTNMCPDNLGNLQWSVFSSFQVGTGAWTNSFGVFPVNTCWYTVPRASANIQTTPVSRLADGAGAALEDRILGVSQGANAISYNLASTNVYNNALVVLEPESLAASGNLLTTFIGDPANSADGDFGDVAFGFTVENTTSNSFTTAAISDFYMNVPASAGKRIYIDPITGLQNGTADYLGYFTLNPNGNMTFTRASAVTAPSAGTVTSTVTNGFSPLQVVFTNTASGTITSWVWNFGNGIIITNSTSASVTNTYAAAGDYTVTLTVIGPGGSSTNTLSNFIVASPTPKIGAALVGGKFVLSGTNCPAGVQYRILNTTNLAVALAGWNPVVTNTFLSNSSFSYTNSTTNAASFFRLVSP